MRRPAKTRGSPWTVLGGIGERIRGRAGSEVGGHARPVTSQPASPLLQEVIAQQREEPTADGPGEGVERKRKKRRKRRKRRKKEEKKEEKPSPGQV